MRAILQAGIFVGLAAVGAWTTSVWHPRAPALRLVEEPLRDDEVSLSRVMDEWNGEVIWLDARPRSEYEKGHIPGAYLLNEEGFLDQLIDLLDVLQMAERPVIIYCNGARCEASRKIREQLMMQFPLEDVWVLKGGWPMWLAEEMPVVAGLEPGGMD